MLLNNMEASIWRLNLCVVAVVVVCGSGRGSSAVSTEGLPLKDVNKLSRDSGVTELTCIASWQDLIYIFVKEAKEKRTPLLPAAFSRSSLVLIHIHKYGSKVSDVYNNGTTLSSNYCQHSDSEDECAMIAVYSQSLFEVYPGALLASLSAVLEYFTHFHQRLRETTDETSWMLPLPFCSKHFEVDIVKDFVYELMKSASDDSKQLVDNVIMPFRVGDGKYYCTCSVLLLYFLSICSSLTILLVLCWLTKQYPLHHQRSMNSVCKSLLFSIMLQSWMWFMYLYAYQFRGLSLFKDFLHSRSAVVATAYMPFVDIGYYAFATMGVFYLVEFPFLLWYISTKVMAMGRRGLNRRQCMLNMLKSVGCAGIVLFMQVASWYFIHFLIGFLAYPFLIIAIVVGFLTIILFLTAITALLLLPCLTQCRRCPQQGGPIVFLALIALICGGFALVLLRVLEGKWNTSYSSNQIVSGIFAFGILAMLAYTVKSVLTQYNVMLTSDSQVGTDESDEQMLQPV